MPVNGVVPPTTAPAAKVTGPSVPAVIDRLCAPFTVELALKLTAFPALFPVSVIAPPPAANTTGPTNPTPVPAVFTKSVPFSVVLVVAV